MEISNNAEVIIIGAGWAGLSCAIKLAKAGKKVWLLEAAPQVGGRARAININDHIVDNGQHILINAYHHTKEILNILQVDLDRVFLKLPLQLRLVDNKLFKLNIANKILPPWNILFGLFCARGFSWQEKLLLSQGFAKIKQVKFNLTQDDNILNKLSQYKQTTKLIRNFWQPLATAVMSTAIEMASSQIFFKVLQDAFIKTNAMPTWLWPKIDLSSLFCTPAINFLQQYQIKINYCTRAEELILVNNHCVGVKTNRGIVKADKIVLATPVNVTAKLLANNLFTQKIAKDLARFTFETITTVYFFFKDKIRLPFPIMGLLGGLGQWLFARDNYTLSVIITGEQVKEYTQNLLIKIIYQQIINSVGNLPLFEFAKVICEKRAAFSCTPEINALRPGNTTAINNLFLAGDYTQTGYPATLEGAVLSGVNCAKEV